MHRTNASWSRAGGAWGGATRGSGLALLSAALTACGGGVAIEDVPDEYATVICEQSRSCAGDFGVGFVTIDNCEEQVAGGLRNEAVVRWEAAIAAGTASYDPDAAAACVEDFQAAGCDLLGVGTSEACASVLVGNVEVGGACSFDEECAGEPSGRRACC